MERTTAQKREAAKDLLADVFASMAGEDAGPAECQRVGLDLLAEALDIAKIDPERVEDLEPVDGVPDLAQAWECIETLRKRIAALEAATLPPRPDERSRQMEPVDGVEDADQTAPNLKWKQNLRAAFRQRDVAQIRAIVAEAMLESWLTLKEGAAIIAAADRQPALFEYQHFKRTPWRTISTVDFGPASDSTQAAIERKTAEFFLREISQGAYSPRHLRERMAKAALEGRMNVADASHISALMK